MPRQTRLSWELGSALLEGWTGSTLLSSTGALVHKDGLGFGGLRCGFTNSAGFSSHESVDFKHGPTAEVKCRAYMRALTAFSSEGRIEFIASDLSVFGSVRYTEVDDRLHIYTGAGTLVASSLGTLFPTAYQRIEVHWFVADGGVGFCRVYVNDDGSYSTPFVEFTGDTKPGAATQVSRVRIIHKRQMVQDDFAINTIGLRYKIGIGGAPVVGETITDAVTLATAVVESVNGTSVGGFCIVSQVTGTFGDGNQITTGGTFDAQVDAPTADYVDGLMPHSDFPGDGVIVYEPAAGNSVANAPNLLTGDDGDKVDNYLRVDDLPISATNQNVASGVNLEFDTYGKGTLPSSAVTVKAVETVHSSQKDGTTINNARHAMRFGGVNYFPADSEYALPNDWETNIHTWDTKPDGTGAFSVADVDAAETEPGFQVRT